MTSQDVIRIANISNYMIEINENEMILTPKFIEILITSKEELLMEDLTSSIIIECMVKNNDIIITEKTKYRTILIDIWKVMSVQMILQKTTFNFALANINGINGYNWNSELNMSFQSKDANSTMKEILNMIEINNFNIEIKIKLKNGVILNVVK
jgi:predicted RecB family nuclease